MKRFFQLLIYIKPYKTYAALNIIFNIFSAVFALFSFTLVIPFLGILFGTQPLVTEPKAFELNFEFLKHNFYYYISWLINNHGKESALLLVCILVVLSTLLKVGFKFLANYYITFIRIGILKDIRNQLYEKVLKLPLSFFTESRKGDMLTRMTADVLEIEMSVMSSLELIFRDPFTIILFLAFLFSMSVQLTLFVLVLLPISAFLIGRISKSLRTTSRKGQQKLGIVTSVLEETLSGLRVIKAFNGEEKMKKYFRNTNELFSLLLMKIHIRRYLANPLSEFLGTVVLILLMWFGGNLVIGGTSALSPQEFMAYLVVFSQVITPAKAFSATIFSLQKGLASVDRIDEVLNADDVIIEKENPTTLTGFNSTIEYKNVNFAYGMEPVLKNINLIVPKGKTIALVGKSGSGKSTLVDLLPRFIDVIGGEICIDGINIKDFRLKELRHLMGVVSQQSILFNDSFYNNIAFGVNYSSEEDVIAAAKIANAHEFIMATPHGYYTNIGEGGGKLSGGQKQRISIARAVLKNPPILILDEATSALDTESERLVQEAIINLMKNRTSIVIAHRLSTIKFANEICVLDDGKIVERGKHDELLAANGAYTRLHEMQMF
jgi:ATP-binding cassette, subfamily B, bacterial MsbA